MAKILTNNVQKTWKIWGEKWPTRRNATITLFPRPADDIDGCESQSQLVARDATKRIAAPRPVVVNRQFTG
jgi:hypothetical protein